MIKLDLIILENKLDKDYEDIKLLMYLEPIKEGLNYLTCVTRNYIFNGIDIKDRNTLLIIDNKK